MKLTVVDITRENWAKLLWLFLELGVWLGVSQSLSLSPYLSLSISFSLSPSLSPSFRLSWITFPQPSSPGRKGEFYSTPTLGMGNAVLGFPQCKLKLAQWSESDCISSRLGT